MTMKHTLTALARLRHAAVTAQTAVVPLAQRTEVRSYDAAKSARRWLAHHGGLSTSEAAALVRAATAVRHQGGSTRCQPGATDHGSR